MEIKEIEILISDFEESADQVNEDLCEVQKIIKERKIPSDQSVTKITEGMAELKSKFSFIKQRTEELMGEPISDVENLAATDFVTILSEYEKNKLESKLLWAENTMKAFVLVTSDIEGYIQALKPSQEEASNNLKAYSEKKIDGEALIEAVKYPSLFMRAIELDDIYSEEGLNLTDEIGDVFPKRVMAGIAARKYYVPDDAALEDIVAEEAAANDSEENAESEPKSEVEDESETEYSDEAIEELLTCDTQEEAKVSDDNLPEDGLVAARNNPSMGSPSASSLKKELKKFGNGIGFIIPLLTNLGALSEKQIYHAGVCMDIIDDEGNAAKEGLPSMLAIMESKGLIAAFDLGDGEALLSLSRYVQETLKKESIRNGKDMQWKMSFGDYDFKTEKSMPKSKLEHAYQSNTKLLLYLDGVRKKVDSQTYKKIIQAIKWDGEHYSIKIPDDTELIDGQLIIDEAELAQISTESVLLCSEISSDILKNDSIKHVFCMYDGELKDVLRPEALKGEMADADETVDGGSDTEKTAAEAEKDSYGAGSEADTESLEEEIAALMNVHSDMSDSELCDYALQLLNRDGDTQFRKEMAADATALAKAASMEEDFGESKSLYRKLLLGTGLPLDEKDYSYTEFSSVFEIDTPDVITLSALINALLTPGVAYDHALHSTSEMYLRDYDALFAGCDRAKDLLNQVNRIWSVSPNGFSASVMAKLGDDKESQKFLSEIGQQAKELMLVPLVKTRMKTLPVMYNLSFGNNSDLYMCMSIISENNTADAEIVKDVLEEYCDIIDGEYNISKTKLDVKLDEVWTEANPGNYFQLDYDARPQALKHFIHRLTIMKSWIEHIGNSGTKSVDISKLKTLREEIINACEKTIEGIDEIKTDYKNVLFLAASRIKDYLNGESYNPFEGMAFTGVVSLDENGLPIIDEDNAGISYCQPWRAIIKHIETPRETVDKVVEDILDRNSLLFDNLNQLYWLGKVAGKSGEDFEVGEQRRKKAFDAAEAKTKQFRERLELAYTYDQINENLKETLASIMEQQKDKYYKLMDYGCWRQFLQGLERQIFESAIKGKKDLQDKISSRLSKDPNSTILKEAQKLLEKDNNLAVTEEYLNRYDAGEREVTLDMEFYYSPREDFSYFLSNEVYEPLLAFGKDKANQALKSCGWGFVSGRIPADWTNRLKDDSKALIDCWPARKGVYDTAKIKRLIRGLGLPVNDVEALRGEKEDTFRLSLEPIPRGLADYQHPISDFGTRMKSSMNVIVLYGNHTPAQIVETVSRADNKGFSIVLIDRAIEKVTRRQIGELSHQKSGQNPFLLIDWVLFLHLAMQDDSRRLPILLACTLPYTIYQPFVRDMGPTADEMFCGRTRELNTIMDPNGASVVYGGRQLGKTALLERTESRCHNPEKKEYAVFCTIYDKKTEQEVTTHIIEEINKKTSLKLQAVGTLKEFCQQIEKRFNSKEIAAFWLLLDECDDFFAAIAKDSYRQIQDMVNLKRNTKNAFKFVFAGLHNVCRAKNSTEKNGVFGQLGEPLCIKPLAPTDALQLLARPLSYMGFQIDPYPHLKTILTKTNYYPGILQFFGYKLLETLTDQYSKYYSAANGNPPFTLKDEQLGAVLSSADLNNSIKAKFRWSLELDQRYFMIARCITMLYYFEESERVGNWKGFSVEQIMSMAANYNIHCLENMSRSEYVNLLDEMEQMGILSKTQQEAYRLRRSSFIGIIGADMDSLDRDIEENNREEVAG